MTTPSIRARIILSGLAVGAVVFAAELIYVMGPLSAQLGDVADRQARRMALVVSERLEGHEELALEARNVVAALAPRLNRRITVVAIDGRTLADSSSLTPDPKLVLASEEVTKALAAPGIIFTCEKRGEDDQIEYRFAAVTIPRTGKPRAVVRVGLPLDEVHELRRKQLMAVLTAGAVGIATTLLLGLVFSRRALLPLEQVAEVALAVQKGELGRRAPVAGNDLVARLARSINELAENQQARLLALARDRALLLALLDGTAEGVAVVDAEGRVLASNGRFREIADAPESPEGRRLGEILNDPELELAVRQASQAGPHQGESVTTTRSTSRRRPGSTPDPDAGEDLIEEESLAVRVRVRPVELPGIGGAAICLVEPLERAKDELQAEVARLLDEVAGAQAPSLPASARETLDLARAALDLETRPPAPEVVAGSVLGVPEAPPVFVSRSRLELGLALLRLDNKSSGPVAADVKNTEGKGAEPAGPPFATEVATTRVVLVLRPHVTGRASLARRLALTALRAAGGTIEPGADGRTRASLPRA